MTINRTEQTLGRSSKAEIIYGMIKTPGVKADIMISPLRMEPPTYFSAKNGVAAHV